MKLKMRCPSCRAQIEVPLPTICTKCKLGIPKSFEREKGFEEYRSGHFSPDAAEIKERGDGSR